VGRGDGRGWRLSSADGVLMPNLRPLPPTGKSCALSTRAHRIAPFRWYRRRLIGAMGLILVIGAQKLKLYVPAGAAGADVFARLVDRFPIERVSDRKAA
jgi:hypothetical protein